MKISEITIQKTKAAHVTVEFLWKHGQRPEFHVVRDEERKWYVFVINKTGRNTQCKILVERTKPDTIKSWKRPDSFISFIESTIRPETLSTTSVDLWFSLEIFARNIIVNNELERLVLLQHSATNT